MIIPKTLYGFILIFLSVKMEFILAFIVLSQNLEGFPTMKNDRVMELLGQFMSLPSSWFLLTLYFSRNRQKDGVDHICTESYLIFQAECKTGKCDFFRDLTAVWLLNNYCQCYQLSVCTLKSLILISKNLFSYSLCRCKRIFSQHSLSYRKYTLQRLYLSELNFSQTLYS